MNNRIHRTSGVCEHYLGVRGQLEVVAYRNATGAQHQSFLFSLVSIG